MAKPSDKLLDDDGKLAEILRAAFNMTPAAAIDYFLRLGLMVDWDWRDDATLAGELGFSIAKVADLQVLAAVKDEIIRALRLGITQKDFRRHLAGRLAELGWLGQREVVMPDGSLDVVDLSRASRMNVIFRTNMQTAYMAGRYQAQLANIGARPFGMYIAVLDARTRATHAAMHGRIYRLDDPIWKIIYPPCGFNCRCRVMALTSSEIVGDVLVGDEADLPQGFPDEGFGNNAGIPGAFEQNIAQAYMRANSLLESAPPALSGL